MRAVIAIGLVAFALSGCALFTNEGYRTTRAYEAAPRGREVYDMPASLEYAEKLNNHLSSVFDARTKTVLSAIKPPGGSGQTSWKEAGSHRLWSAPGSGTQQDPTEGATSSYTLPVQPTFMAPGATGASSSGNPGMYYYNLDKFWPIDAVKMAMNRTDPQNMTTLAREINNIFFMQYIRDLTTEPSIYSMLPTHRDVTLSCTPPPEQSVIQTAVSIAASADWKDAKGALDTRLAESVVKLFEQSERTIFLQYALFRLCEMSINSAGEFRNVFPMVMHELVRQSADLTLEARVEAERAKKAAADADATVAQVEVKRLECVKAQQELKRDTTAEAIAGICGAPPRASISDTKVEGIKSPAKPTTPEPPNAPIQPVPPAQ